MALKDEPRDWALDADGDIDLSGGDAHAVSGKDAVAQAIDIRLGLFRGEAIIEVMQNDEGKAVPWLARNGVPESQAILGQKYDAFRVRETLRTVILNTDDKLTIQSLDLEFDDSTRLLSVSGLILTEFDDTPIEIDFSIGGSA